VTDLANIRVDYDDYKINVKLRLKRHLRQEAKEYNINLSHLLERALLSELKKEKEKVSKKKVD